MENSYQYAYLGCIRPEVSLTRYKEKSFQVFFTGTTGNANITGILVFDGWRFQYIEGADDTVLDLVRKLRRDERHHQFSSCSPRRLPAPAVPATGRWVTRSRRMSRCSLLSRGFTPGEVVLRIPRSRR